MPRSQAMPLGATCEGPLSINLDRLQIQRPFPEILRERVARGIASRWSISRSQTSRKLRGERPVSVNRFGDALQYLMDHGLSLSARAAVSGFARIVRCDLIPWPEIDRLKSSRLEAVDVNTAAAKLVALQAEHDDDDIRTLEEIDRELAQLDEIQRELDEARAARIKEREELSR